MQLKARKGMRLTIGVQILATCIAIVAIFTGLNIYTYFQMQDIENGYMGLVKRSAPLVFDIKDIKAELNAQSSLVRAYILTGDAEYIQNYDVSRLEMRNKIADLEKKLTTLEGKQKVGELKQALEEYHKVADQAVVVRKNEGQAEAVKFVAEAGPKIKAAEKSTFSAVHFLTEQMELRVKQNQAASDRVHMIILTLSGIILVLAVGISIDLARRISRPLAGVVAAAEQIAMGDLTQKAIDYQGDDEIKDMLSSFKVMTEHLRTLITHVAKSAEQLATASEQLTASTEQSAQASGQVAQTVTEVAAGAADQVSSVDQAVAVVKVMASAIEHIAQNASVVSDKSKDTTRAATAGIATMTEASQQMLLINLSVSQSAQVVQKLGESSKQIGEIVDAISSIAGQTNLLALNAAIEAARAGEQGRGFAVVADEVRKLAEQCQEAAHTISDIVREIQSETDNVVTVMDKGSAEASKGTEIMDATGARFKEIVGLVNNLNGQIQAISSAAEELSASSEDVVSAVEGVKSVAAETAASTQTISAAAQEQSASLEEVTSSSHALARLAEDLQKAIRAFRL